jgi:hypothetical protein
MRSNTKLTSKKKPTKSSAINAKKLEKQRQFMAEEVSDNKSVSKKEAVLSTASNIESLRPDLYDAADGIINSDLYTLRYNIDEKGIGQILLPPSLSTLLQSDRVCISPSAGGLFIKPL